MSRADDLLVGLGQCLDDIAAVLAAGRPRYDTDPWARLALQRLWIIIGNLAEAYRGEVGLAEGTEPWAELYVYRCVLAHALPGELDEGRIWEESVSDITRVRVAIGARS